MANERLRAALLERGVSIAELATAIQVDPKTVERWITKGRALYRKHRYAVATHLGMDEGYLWPEALTREQVASASESEIVTVYPHRWAVPGTHGDVCSPRPRTRSASWSTSACFSPTMPGSCGCSARRPQPE
ncbi:helix-turn-helix transcriptional regulator [Microbispora sp. NPDC046933]|uniref:helix-turn-helix domain-containing protein n=1 Tax=Microbispora sp. NPDC046933 TaxID=3155618 RepID=UPI0033FB4C0D